MNSAILNKLLYDTNWPGEKGQTPEALFYKIARRRRTMTLGTSNFRHFRHFSFIAL
jgi:hypothetical protein